VSSTSSTVSEAVGRVEAQLNAFWSAANQGDEAKVRLSTMNFVAVGMQCDTDRLREEVEDLAQTRAGRVFLMTVDGRLGPWDVENDVRALCHKEGDQIVCYDRIELSFGQRAASRAASVLGALALPEVPTIVEAGAGAPRVIVDPLILACDRIIVDSAYLGASRIAEIARKTKAPIADRSFIRMFSFRDLVAGFFDDAVDATRSIREVEIDRTGTPDGAPLGKLDPAALFFGWLASRLGWKFEGPDLAVDERGRGISLSTHIVPSWDDLGPGEITRVRISTTLHGSPLELSCSRQASSARTVRWVRTGALSETHDHALGFHDEGWVLRKAIDATEGDGIYRQAVELAAEWSTQ
jgi:glucose-6-phosphate dehydrogenase assembly protein OpcA